MISIIIPVYKAERTLKKCVESLLRQTSQDFEILLVDDGSPDGSGAICDTYAARDSRILALHKENGGVSSARNVGLCHARGEWISFVDADDYVGECFLENFFKNGLDADMMVQGLTLISTDDSLCLLSDKDGSISGSNIIDYVLKGIQSDLLGYSPCKLFRRDIIRRYNVRFDESYHQREDLLFIMEYLAHVSKIILIESYQYQYLKPAAIKRYRIQDNVGLNFRLCDTMLKIGDAGKRKREIMGLFYGYILANLLLGENVVPKRLYINRFIERFYVYRNVLPMRWYRKKLVPYVLFFRIFDCKLLYTETLKILSKS